MHKPTDFSSQRPPAHVWGEITVPPGEDREVRLAISESYSGLTIPIPVVIHRGLEDGPAVFVTAAIHGDEINGTGIIRALVHDSQLNLKRGTLILVPVVNILGFERHSRYLPDRRDLNRCFPGQDRGSLAQRMARILFDEVILRCDYGIDLHTAAVRRTNFPNIRAEMSHPEVARIARAFGCELILDSKGPPESLRREATAAGCPTVVLEAGEVWKVERAVVEYGLRGIRSVLAELGMLDATPRQPTYQLVLQQTRWVRASAGGFLRFHVSPGDVVREGDALATNTTLTGTERDVIHSPHDAIVIGMTTLPCLSPGDPVCHLGLIPEHMEELLEKRASLPEGGLHRRVIKDLSTNLRVVEPTDPNST